MPTPPALALYFADCHATPGDATAARVLRMSEAELLTAAAELVGQLPACAACAPDLPATAAWLRTAADEAERTAWLAAGAPSGTPDDPCPPWRQDWRRWCETPLAAAG